MKIALDLGHGVASDRGAVGIRTEEELINLVGDYLQPLLEKAGHQVVLVRPKTANNVRHSLQQRVEMSSSMKADLFISIHFNAFNGKANGSEVFAASNRGRQYAAQVQKNLVGLGFVNRGVKDGSHLYVIKKTIAPAILVECCFCDSAIDMDLFNAESVAMAIAKF
jgi:N-acetylmuramoyl-L-alanine amidase